MQIFQYNSLCKINTAYHAIRGLLENDAIIYHTKTSFFNIMIIKHE